MTAAPPTTKVPLSPLARTMFTLATIGTLAAFVHAAFALTYDSLPPQLMTLHVFIVIGFWGAGFHYRTKAPATVPHPTWTGPQQRNFDNALDDFVSEAEIDELERRLRETDW